VAERARTRAARAYDVRRADVRRQLGLGERRPHTSTVLGLRRAACFHSSILHHDAGRQMDPSSLLALLLTIIAVSGKSCFEFVYYFYCIFIFLLFKNLFYLYWLHTCEINYIYIRRICTRISYLPCMVDFLVK